MNKKSIWIIIIFLVIVLLPVAIKSIIPKESRTYTGNILKESNYTEISFLNKEQSLSLSGLLFRPKGDGPFPTAVIIHGSGTSRRDNIWYLTLVNHLQENGIMVLLPDKRGSENSEGNWTNSSFEDLASDTKAAIDYLNTAYSNDVKYLGIVGMSQGGHIAPIVANEETNLNFVVNVAGAAVPMHEQFLYEENHNLREIGFLPGISNLLSYASTYYHRELGHNKAFWNTIGNYDPLPDWDSIQTRTLILYGEEDTNAPVKQSKTNLEALNNKQIKINIYSRSEHPIQDPKGSGTQIIRKDALNDISTFIKTEK